MIWRLPNRLAHPAASSVPGRARAGRLARGEPRLPNAARRSIRWHNRHCRRVTGRAGFRGGIGLGCRSRFVRGDRMWVLRGGVRRYPFPNHRPDGTDGRRDGGHRYRLREQSRRGPGRRCHGRPAAGAAGPVGNRTVRRLHPARRRLRFHVGHRHHRRGDSSPAVLRRRCGSWRCPRYARCLARGLGEREHQCVGDRYHDAFGCRFLAAPIGEADAGTALGVDRGNLALRLVAWRRTAHRAGSHRVAELPVFFADGEFPSKCGRAGADSRPYRLGRQSPGFPGGRLTDTYSAHAQPGACRSRVGQRIRRTVGRGAGSRVAGADSDQHPCRRTDAGVGGVLCAAHAGIGAGSRTIRRAHPPCGARRNSGQDRLGRHRLAPTQTGSSPAAGASGGHARDAWPYRVR